jgi:N-acetylglucosaminyldiphosphoundecaprenol N-acetyl-beta-D-mannosaminyltransferase
MGTAARRPAAADFGRDVYCILGLPFDAVDMAGAVLRVRDAVARRKPCFISTPNLNFLIGCRNDRAFRGSVIDSDLSIADGMPLVWIARLLGVPIPERVAGAGLFEALRRDVSHPLAAYFFGGPEGVAEAACARLNAAPSGVRCAGWASPGFGSVEDMSGDAAIAAINASGADFLLVSLGAKKGQAWIERNRAGINVPVISHLGAVVNFVAGRLARAPGWMQRSGLEWLWRIREEPGLWRRYASDGLALAGLLVTRVVPHFLHIHRHAPVQPELDRAAIDTQQSGGETILRLRGAWTRGNLGALRAALSAAQAADTDVRIDLGDVSYVDSAVLGLLMLLYGSQAARGRRLSCVLLDRRVRKAFEYGCCEFLLAPELP